MKIVMRRFAPLALLAICSLASVAEAQHYTQTNLVSDTPGLAPITDPNLVNPWGLSRASDSPWWVANNNSGTSTLYDGVGNPQGLIVTIPPAVTGSGSPTGTMFNGTNDFEVTPGNPAQFLFVTEDGTISGWNPSANPTQAIVKVNMNPGSVFKGATLLLAKSHLLYVADFRQARVLTFDKHFQPVNLGATAFQDPQIPAGFAPFNVQNIGDDLYVTFAMQDPPKHDPVGGPGLGFVDVFRPDGVLLRRLQHGQWENAPWGVVLAPGDFGTFSHHVLVGQFRSGEIVAYDAVSGKVVNKLRDTQDKVLKIDGVWALSLGNGGSAGKALAVYFSAGIQGEAHGLFGTLTPVPSELIQGNGN
jgi:uncharacterized protein (TIGR03118 family)